MARAMLHDDYARSYPSGGSGILLDDDGRSSVPAGVSDTPGPGVPGAGVPASRVNPLVTVRARVSGGYDDDGNPIWAWTSVVTDVEAILWEDRTEISDKAGTVVTVGTFTVLYPEEFPDIAETAQVLSDGKLWRIRKVDRATDRITLTVERVGG
jgi:hypothetical protein